MNTALLNTLPKPPPAPPSTAVNEAGGRAYALSPRAALAQYAATGCLSGTYYAADAEQLTRTLALLKGVADEPGGLAFVAKTAVYARECGFMKDMPAVLAAYLTTRGGQGEDGLKLCAAIFPRVIDNGRMLRNFVQVIRSGALGRKSLGTAPKRLVRQWLCSRDPGDLFNDSVGNTPSIADVVKMVHPKPMAGDQHALFAYLIGRPHETVSLPAVVREMQAFAAAGGHGDDAVPPKVHFNLLTALPLTAKHWARIARDGGWQFVRMNLNTFARHGVFAEPGMTKLVADKLRDPESIRRSRCFPYQLLAAFANAGDDVPAEVRLALQDAMEVATENVPALQGRVYVCPDVSGSMSSPVTGHRAGATSKVRCVDVAGLVAACVLRHNPAAEVIPFDTQCRTMPMNPRDSVMTNAAKLATLCGGGTDCAAPVAWLNDRAVVGDGPATIIFVSDNESWWKNVPGKGVRGSRMAEQWLGFKKRNPAAKLVCIDVQPYDTTQVGDAPDVLNVGGFSDNVFTVVEQFLAAGGNPNHWVDVIDQVELQGAS